MAKYKKGESGNLAGRPSGIANKATEALRRQIGSVIDKNFTIDKVSSLLNELEAKDRLQVYLQLLSYITPKLRSVENKIEVESNFSMADLLKD
jgi:hypothetical protein